MKEYVMIPFQVKKESIEDAKKIIHELIAQVRDKEPGTVQYESLQMKSDETSFVHFIVFADNESHVKHRSAPYVMDFVKKLYDLCPGDPFPVFLEPVASCGSAAGS